MLTTTTCVRNRRCRYLKECFDMRFDGVVVLWYFKSQRRVGAGRVGPTAGTAFLSFWLGNDHVTIVLVLHSQMVVATPGCSGMIS